MLGATVVVVCLWLTCVLSSGYGHQLNEKAKPTAIVRFDPQDMEFLTDETSTFKIFVEDLTEDAAFTFKSDPEDLDFKFDLTVTPDLCSERLELHREGMLPTFCAPKGNSNFTINVRSAVGGRFSLLLEENEVELDNVRDAVVRLIVYHSDALLVLSQIVGWMYFVAWSVSFWPQVFLNWKRKSVIGLSLDYQALNVVGHSFYCFFTISLFFCSYIQDLYYEEYPAGVIPVRINDVFFTVHAVFATAITVIQCFIYERGGQVISVQARGLLAIFALVTLVSIIVAAVDAITWLMFLNILSYIKLAITLVKYLPQMYMNYLRKSTEGFSIGAVLLDLAGGLLNDIQLFFDAGNYDDWIALFGDFAKFGLGTLSFGFNIIFIVQHYFLYRGNDGTITVKT